MINEAFDVKNILGYPTMKSAVWIVQKKDLSNINVHKVALRSVKGLTLV